MHERANRRNKVLGHSGILSLLLVLGHSSATLAQSDEETGRSYAYGNLSVVDGDVWHQRADDFGAHEAERGSPFLPGDRIWTREPGQVELRFAGRVTAWMDQGTKLDYVEGDSPHRLGFWTGSLILWLAGDADVVVETPGGTFSPQGEGEYRTDLLEDGRTVQFVVYSGIATVSTESGSVLVGSGQRTVASEGVAPAPPEEYLGNDHFYGWAEDRQRRFVTTAETHYDELPEEVREHAHDLDGHGHWHHDVHLGWVWYPTVTAGWAPYRLGRWAHTPFGLTWISYDPWGWAPYHYGRWGHGPRGWYWLPGSVWGPGWVSWSYGYDWVGWSPLGYYGYAVYPFRGWYGGYDGYGGVYSNRPRVRRGQILGKAVPRGSVNRQAWSFTSRKAIGRPASRNRLAASTLRNVENAQVLAGGAVLDRGLRQRAIGDTAMTRSAKATTRRLSNSRAPTAARRAATGSARSTSRAQRVAVPRSAARARSARSAYAAERDRGTLSRGAAGRDASARSPQAGRSRATSRGRATTGNRPAAAPRPRATGRSGDSGARRPSAVRPASPRSGATSTGRSGASRARPSGASRGRPSGASRSRPSGASRSRPSGASRSRPSGASRSRPSGASRSRPSAGSRSRPSAGSRSRPSAGSRSRPSAGSRSHPSASARSRPSGFSRSGGVRGASASRGGGSSTGGSGSAISRGGGGGGGAAATRGGGSSGGSRGSSSGNRRPNNN
ncbi:MAG: hypothetical protein F4Z74_04555 [Acidobacteria bacterium]|nr:hypothetical protein [Acidobacteriota bacterium]MYE43190.1 hypothetical protein [Acidobacteriota bacterium]